MAEEIRERFISRDSTVKLPNKPFIKRMLDPTSPTMEIDGEEASVKTMSMDGKLFPTVVPQEQADGSYNLVQLEPKAAYDLAMDTGNYLDAGDDALRVRGRKLGKLLRGEVVCPRVKQLHDLCTRLDLIADIIRQLIGQMRQHRVQQRRVVHHHLLRLGAVPVSLALDRIRGQRPRRPDESQHGRLITHLLPQRLQSLRHERQSRRRIVQRDQPRKIVCVPDGIGNDGPRPLDHVKLDPHGRQHPAGTRSTAATTARPQWRTSLTAP